MSDAPRGFKCQQFVGAHSKLSKQLTQKPGWWNISGFAFGRYKRCPAKSGSAGRHHHEDMIGQDQLDGSVDRPVQTMLRIVGCAGP